jgi:hypothetical protein
MWRSRRLKIALAGSALGLASLSFAQETLVPDRVHWVQVASFPTSAEGYAPAPETAADGLSLAMASPLPDEEEPPAAVARRRCRSIVRLHRAGRPASVMTRM